MLCERTAGALLLLALVGCGVHEEPRPADGGGPRHLEADAPAERLLERVVVIGASASAGFELEDSLADALRATLDGTVLDLADQLLFLSPVENGGAQVEAALAADPTLVIAIDFPFWFGYGVLDSAAARMELLEIALTELERFACPVVVGGFPDMSAAVGTLLRAEHVPAPATLARLNARLAEWVDARDHVVLVDLPAAIERLGSGEPLELFGEAWPPDDDDLLQWDRLHPTDHGLVALAGIVLERVAESYPDAGIAFDAAAVFAAID